MTTWTWIKTIRTLLKALGTISAICLLGYFSYKLLSMDPAGYCRAQDRYITDEEFLKATIAIYDRNGDRDVMAPGGKIVGKLKDHRNLYKNADFDRSNPNCCLVMREETHFIFNRLFGLQDVVVALNSRTGTSDVELGDNQIRFFYDVCGRLWDSYIGAPNSAFRDVTTRNIGD